VSGALSGKRVLVARAAGQTESAARALREAGAEPVVIPCIVIGPVGDGSALREAVRDVRDTDWVVFTSENGVAFTWAALEAEGLGRDAFGHARFAVVGSATLAALKARGVVADVVAKEFRGEGLATELVPRLGGPRRTPVSVVLFRAQDGGDALPKALIEAGAEVDVVPTYRTKARPEGAHQVRRLLETGELDVVVLSSGSIAESLADALGDDSTPLLGRVTVAAIGPVTGSAAARLGLRVDVVAREATIAGLVRALVEHLHRN
jgi:uroporphyrinogen III methyltransferase / synthase